MVELLALLTVLQSKPTVITPDPIIIEHQFVDKTLVWPGVGEIDPDDLPDDGTGRSGSDVMNRDNESDDNGSLVISVQAVPQESEAAASESVPQEPEVSEPVSVPQEPEVSEPLSVPHEPVASEPVSVPQEPEVSEPVSVSQEPEAAEPVSVPQEPETAQPVSVSQEPEAAEPVSVPQEPEATESEFVSQESDVALESEITQSDYSVGFQVILFAVGFLGGCIATFALFKHMRSR